jgi:hypothetical protein
MNKAFIREPDETSDRNCPRCGSLGVAVAAETLDAQLSGAARRLVAESAWFCPFARCEVIYFDAFERVVNAETFGKPVYPKDPDAPICSCFGLGIDEIEQDIAEGGVARVRELVNKAKTPTARCALLAPSGQCCVPEVQRAFMQLRAARQSP